MWHAADLITDPIRLRVECLIDYQPRQQEIGVNNKHAKVDRLTFALRGGSRGGERGGVLLRDEKKKTKKKRDVLFKGVINIL